MSERQARLRENNILNGRPENTRLPYEMDEIELIAKTAPTRDNCKLLASTLKRSENAIAYIWWLLSCSVRYLKTTYGSCPHIDKIIKVKKKVGYSISNTPIKPREDVEEIN